MDGLHELVGPSTVPITINGREYQLTGLTLKHYGEIEREFLQSLPSPLESIKSHLAGLSAEHAEVLLNRAYDETVRMRRATPAQLAAYMNSIEGSTFLLWLCLRPNHPELSREQLTRYVHSLDSARWDELRSEINRASGLLGNSSGRREGSTLPTAGPTTGAASSAG